MQEKSIILPVEIFERELPYKAPLSILLAEIGYTVYLGRQQEIRLFWPNKSNFIYIDKSSARTKLKLFKDIKDYGGHIGVFCEEGLVFRNSKQYLAERIYSESYDLIDIFWCWGLEQFKAISNKYNRNKLEIITSPRIGLIYNFLSKNKEKKYLKNSILFLTSFGIIDNKLKRIEILKKRGTFDSKIGEKFYLDWDEYTKKYRKEFILLIKECIEKFPDYRFELKIHPSENKEVYNDLVIRNQNLNFSKFEVSAEAIANNDVVISSMSTTSIEASILKEKDSIVYSPIKDDRFRPEIIKNSCNIISNKKEIIDYLKYRKKGEFNNEITGNYLNVNSKNSIQILKDYALSINKTFNKTQNKQKRFNLCFLYIKLKYLFKCYLRNGIYFLRLRKMRKIINNKCRDITKEDILQNANEYLSIDNNYRELLKKYKIEKVSKNIFRVSVRS